MSNLPARNGSAEKPWYRQPYVWMLILIPFSSVVMGAVAVTLALTSDDGVVVDDYYKRGLEINRVLERDRAALRYSLAGTLKLKPARDRVEFTLSAGESFKGPEVLHLGLFHATRRGFDRQLSLRRSSLNNYAGTLPQLVAGDWHLQLEADDWRLIGKFNMPRDREVRVSSSQSS